MNYIGLFGILTFLGSLNLSYGYIITVDAHAEECFYQMAQSNTKMGLVYEIAEGGFLDIDIKITGPDGTVISSIERESSGKITFAADTEGKYTYCFSNRMSTLTPKVVMFNLDVEEAHLTQQELEAEGNQEKLKRMIDELSKSLSTIKQEQEYMKVRDKIHRAINDNTNSRVVVWAIFEAAVLAAMTLGQIYYLKRFFEVRRVV